MGFVTVAEDEGQLLERVRFCRGQETVFGHLAQHHVPPLPRPLRVQPWVIGGGGLQHPHQHGGLLSLERVGGGVKEAPGGPVDAVEVAAHGNGVEVKLQDFFLVINGLEPAGDNKLPNLINGGV